MSDKQDAIKRILGARNCGKSKFTIPFGKFKGSDISEVETSYLKWMVKEGIKTEEAESELERRENV